MDPLLGPPIGRNLSGREGWIAVIPEPATALLLASGLAAMAVAGRKVA